MLFRTSISALLVALGSVAAQAPVSAREMQVRLSELSETLRWHGTTKSTYSAVDPAARAAHSTLIRLAATNPRAVPRAQEFIETLGRLVSESKFLLELSKPRTYQPGFYDGAPFLTGAMNEWHHTINIMMANLQRPSGYRQPRPRSKVNGGNSGRISKSTKPGTEFRDWKDGPTMVVIPTGSYMSGSTEEELRSWNVTTDKWRNELPHRRVRISKPLAFSRTEVELRQFEDFVRETNYKPRGGARWWDPSDPTQMVFRKKINYRNPGFPQTPNCPVVAITIQDARAYARWLSVVTGHKYRLPSEEEWEWAARGGTNTTFFWGNDVTEANLWANTYDQTADKANHFQWKATPGTDGFAYTAPVASFRPNGYGLYDMIANAREFMEDSWVGYLGSSANDGSVHRGPAPFPVLRGAAWDYTVRNLRINYRDPYYSSEVASNMFGMRLVREL
ncbi:hypothetical protein HIM_05792 [Hirsutella minnesotensis 3608]|uniref:Sulfatase-modifying factor enzyme-like domain-containing protein n=1 Tax=Hirsutella minnesotensis 3608 TaxID=1043627 RepID=A0A0F7ZUH7_9HYPO|nr:hypothetical protein HIM_05792 [Hirsutella minnesotensis 3608]